MAIGTKDTNVEQQEFRNGVKPIWCPGCGDHAVLASVAEALKQLNLQTQHVSVITGIGCSSRLPGYLGCYGFNAIHGRPVPIATGLKLARPDQTVIAAGGDGDGFSIGGGHLMHAVRRNIDLTYIIMDNGIYGLTKGQASPTTPLGTKTKTTAYGAFEKPILPLAVMLSYGCPYVAQAFAGDMKTMTKLFMDAIQFPGFAYINVLSPCPTFRGGMGQFKELRNKQIMIDPEKHDVTDWDAAHKLTRDTSAMHIGVMYKEPRASFLETQEDLREKARAGTMHAIDEIVEMYK